MLRTHSIVISSTAIVLPACLIILSPPGTGKTQTIAAAVIRLANAGEPVWIVAQSNVGIRNVADKLRKVGYEDFILIVAQEYFVWW